MFHKSIQYALEKLGKSKSGFVIPELRVLVLTKRHVGSGNEIVPKQTRFRPRNSKKQAPHTKDKLRISRTQSLLIALVSLFCTTYFPSCTKGENHVWKSTLALAALSRSHCCCFGHHVAELGQCEQRKRPMHDLFSLQRLIPHFRFILESNERLSCTIAANFLEILASVHTWRFNVSCFEVLDANKVRY